MKKKIGALLLALTLCLSLVCVPAAAAGEIVTGAYATGVVTVSGTGFPANTIYSMIAVKDGSGNLIALGSAKTGTDGALSGSVTTGAIANPETCKVYIYHDIGGAVVASGAVTGSGSVIPPDPTSFTITATAGAGGTITPNGAVTVAKGASQTFAIAASSGYSISDVTVDGVSNGAISSFTFDNVTAIHTITATFSGGGGGGGGGGGTSGGSVSGSGSDVSISAGGGTVSDSTLNSAVDKATSGSTISINAGGSTNASLPVSGMTAAAGNNNAVSLTLNNGAISLSANAIAGLVSGVSASATISVSISTRSSSSNSTVSSLISAGAKVFDVSVSVGSSAVHSFDGSLSITLTVPNLSSMKSPVVVHVLDNGGQETFTPTISGNKLTIDGVRGLSSFAVMEQDKVPARSTTSFEDVPSGAYYYDAVVWAVEKDITGGTTSTTFSPNASCTRAQVVTFLWRANGSPAVTSNSQFTDVPSGAYYADAVAWAVANGITGGTTSTTFAPGATCTRAQVVTFLHRAEGSPAASSGSNFSDVDSGAYYASAVAWAVAQGVTSGVTASTFAPGATCTRAQVVTFLYRALAD